MFKRPVLGILLCIVLIAGILAALGAINATHMVNLSPSTPEPALTNEQRMETAIVKDAKTVSIGVSHSLVIKSDDSLWAWGENDSGQLGDGTTTASHSPVKIMDSVASVATHAFSSMAIKMDGSLWAWGFNGFGQLGDGTKTDRHSPVKIMDSVASVALETVRTMAIKTDGSLWAWGMNGVRDPDGERRGGFLGDGTTIDRIEPIKVMDNVIAVSLGAFHTMAIKTDGSLWAWGSNSVGQPGDGTTIEHHTPVKIMDGVKLPPYTHYGNVEVAQAR